MISSKIIEDGRFWTVCYARDDDVEQVGVGRAEPCEKAGPPSMIQVRFSSCDQIWLDLSLDRNDNYQSFKIDSLFLKVETLF